MKVTDEQIHELEERLHDLEEEIEGFDLNEDKIKQCLERIVFLESKINHNISVNPKVNMKSVKIDITNINDEDDLECLFESLKEKDECFYERLDIIDKVDEINEFIDNHNELVLDKVEYSLNDEMSLNEVKDLYDDFDKYYSYCKLKLEVNNKENKLKDLKGKSYFKKLYSNVYNKYDGYNDNVHIEYVNKERFYILERGLKKYDAVLFNQLHEYSSLLVSGFYVGDLISVDNGLESYELKIKNDKNRDEVTLKYSVNREYNLIILETIEPSYFLSLHEEDYI